MKEKVLEIINQIRASKDLTTVLTLKASDVICVMIWT